MQFKKMQYNVIDQKDKDLGFGYTRIWCKKLNISRISDEINLVIIIGNLMFGQIQMLDNSHGMIYK